MTIRVALSEQTCELAIIAACVGRVNSHNYTELLQRLIDEMDATEKAHFRKLYSELTFGSRREKCPL